MMDIGAATTLETIETFLLDLYRVYKSSFLYPPSHPSLLAMFVKPFNDISPVLDETEEVSIRYKKGEGFFWGDLPVARRYNVLVELGEELLRRRIQAIFFLKGMKVIELHSLLKVITSDPRSIQDAGGCEKLLERAGIRHIWFNEIDYKKILEDQEKGKEKAPEVAVSAGRAEGGAGIYEFFESAEEEAEAISPPQVAKVEAPSRQELIEAGKRGELPADIDELIRMWNEARSFGDFERIGNSIIEQAPSLAAEKDEGAILKVIKTFLAVTETREERFKEFASSGLDKMVGERGLLDIVLDRSCSKSPDAADAIETLIRLKGKAAGQVADRLATEGDSHARHILSNMLVGMGEDIIPLLLERLGDDRWYMVRNMVRVLGEIGKDGIVEDALRTALGHKEPHVRKETVRALSMIRGPQAPGLLRDALHDGDDSVAELAAVSLGLLRERRAVQPLVDLFDRTENTDIKKEVLRALGRIGSGDAVSFLSRVIKTKSWLGGKKDDEMKAVCAEALADAWTPEAIRALKEGLGSSRDAVRKACEEGLRRVRHG